MRNKKIIQGKHKVKISIPSNSIEDSLRLVTQFSHLKNRIEKLWEVAEDSQERLQDVEIHLNLLTRLLTTLCIEKFGMRVGVLKRLIKRIEKETIRDSQIMHLESLYKLPHAKKESQGPPPPPKNDPWEEIS